MAPMQLDVKGMPLLFAPGLVPIEVDAYLAYCDNGELIEHRAQLCQRCEIIVVNLLGVQP